MSGLLSADHAAALQHPFQHIAVADIRHIDCNACLFHGLMKADIAHHGCRHLILSEASRALEHLGTDRDRFITIYHPAKVIANDEPIRIAVKSQTEVRLQLLYFCSQFLRVR